MTAGVYESSDAGATWTKVTDGHVLNLTAIRDGGTIRSSASTPSAV
jgi:hypothetical protein